MSRSGCETGRAAKHGLLKNCSSPVAERHSPRRCSALIYACGAALLHADDDELEHELVVMAWQERLRAAPTYSERARVVLAMKSGPSAMRVLLPTCPSTFHHVSGYDGGKLGNRVSAR